MAFTGTLQDFNLFSIFGMIRSQNKIGTLLVENETVYVKIYFEDGYVIGINSNAHIIENSIGAILLRCNKLSYEELEKLIEEQDFTLRPMEQIALDAEIITLQDFKDALYAQAMKTVYSTFLWMTGEYRFEPIITDKLTENFPPLSIDMILMETAKLLDEWPKIQEQLPNYTQVLQKSRKTNSLNIDESQDTTLILAENLTAQLNITDLTQEEITILQYFEYPESIDNIIRASRFFELDTCKHIVSLMKKGFLEKSDLQLTTTSSIIKQNPIINTNQNKIQQKPSVAFWPLMATMAILPVFTYIPKISMDINKGLHSLQGYSVKQIINEQTEERTAFVFILKNAMFYDNKLIIPERPSQNHFINTEVISLFKYYHSDPMLLPHSNFFNEVKTISKQLPR